MTTEDDMVGWHHQLGGHELEQAPGDGEGRGLRHAAVHGFQRVGHDLATEQQCDVVSSGIWDKQAQNQGVSVN